MNILVTGARGFVGRNLVAQLRNIAEGKARQYTGLPSDLRIFEYDIESSPSELDAYCSAAEFVFNLAGVNRPQDDSEFMSGNFGFSSTLLDTLRRHGNTCPVMLSSSVQATLSGRFGDSAYGRSKLAGEELFFRYGAETGARVLVYRFPNLFGKWSRPNYNSAVVTFCHAVANGLPFTVRDRSTVIELSYIDDVVEELVGALSGREHHCDFSGAEAVFTASGRYCGVPTTYRVSLGEIVDLLGQFASQPTTLMMPALPAGSFARKLYATYLSYLPKERVSFPLRMNVDSRGSFTEVLRTADCGQFSVNVSRPGVTKGEHWHNTKWELFIVVSGHGLIRERKVGSGEVLEFEVGGDRLEAVHMLPGYTHSLVNLSATEPLITLMWASEPFDPAHADTYHAEV